MAERIEYQGVPLPSGLPGFGGGTVEVLILPGFNTVVAPLKFGPVVDAPAVTPPNPEPPPGSNPDDPTDVVVPPGPAPSPPEQSQPNFCSQCEPPESQDYGQPILYAQVTPSSCTDCQKTRPGTITWFKAASSGNKGIFWEGGESLSGYSDGDSWNLNANTLNLTKQNAVFEIGTDAGQNGVWITKEKIIVSGTEYRKGAKIFDVDTGKTYEPKQLKVCASGESKTWSILAYEEED